MRTLSNAIATGRIAHAFILTGVRGVGKTTTARIIARALNCIGPDGAGGPTIEPVRRVRALPRDRRGPPCRRDRDGRGLAHRRRRHPRADRGRALPAGLGALQGLHHRRSAHALEERLQRAVEDARRAAARRQLRLRHDRDPEGAGDRAVALPALLAAPRAGRAAGRALPPGSPRPKQVEAEPAALGADRPRRRRLGARRAVAARPGDRAGRRRRSPKRRCATCSASPIAAWSSICSRACCAAMPAAALGQLDRALSGRRRSAAGAAGSARSRPFPDPA